jgi:hypothetical protein
MESHPSSFAYTLGRLVKQSADEAPGAAVGRLAITLRRV